jgi:hypothetical protein
MTDAPPTGGLTRARFRAVSASVNAAPSGVWADVLATPDQTGSTLTFYRLLRGKGARANAVRNLEAVYRVAIASDGVSSYTVVEGYGNAPTRDEWAIITQALAAMMEGLSA